MERFLPTLVWDNEVLNSWRNRTISQIEECRSCKYALLCGGGCAQQALEQTGSIYSSCCDYFEEIFLQELPILYREIEAEKQKQELSIAGGNNAL